MEKGTRRKNFQYMFGGFGIGDVRIFHGSMFSSPCFLLHISWPHVFFSIFHGSMFSSPYFMASCFLAPCRLELLFKLL